MTDGRAEPKAETTAFTIRQYQSIANNRSSAKIRRMSQNAAELEKTFLQILDLIEKVAMRDEEEDDDDEKEKDDEGHADEDEVDEDVLVDAVVEEAEERGLEGDKAERVFRAILTLTKK
jgi:hypothetical protein